MTEAYRHDEIAKPPTNSGSAGAARSVRLKLIGTRRKVLWVARFARAALALECPPGARRRFLSLTLSSAWLYSKDSSSSQMLDFDEVLHRAPK
jgi:hypothetical protein